MKRKEPKAKVGRKKAEDPKVGIIFYVHQSEMDKAGGRVACREIAINAVRKFKPKK